uniref:RNA-dependent RNA polymerase n=1 Tax=Plasmopara viticola lesion associated mitovirus 2 TaxID=2719445 RepID=A0A6G9RV87_9VIRU|nr:RNA-dependent RNA polymerase [Plasmopara viticola lesion associated mitovirus 2]
MPIKDLMSREVNDGEILNLIDKSVTRFEKMVNDRGLKTTLQYFKNCRLAFTKHIADCPIYTVEGVELDSRGLPKWMKLPKRELNPNEVRVILSLLALGRSFTTTPSLDVQPIVSKWGGALPFLSRRELLHIFRCLGIRRWEWTWNGYHFSTKSGPNGQAMAGSMADLMALPDELKKYLTLIGGDYIEQAFDYLSQGAGALVKLWYRVFPPYPTTARFRKLSYFADREGKTRVIAILDYWSQTMLKPLHDQINLILRGIPNDCTYNQDSFKSILPSSGPYHSLDLQNATDRMPLALQKMVLSNIIGKNQAEVWGRILTRWEYQSEAGPVFYQTGQPMGAYSSWPVMALTHHFIVRWAALRCGKPHFNKYCLLGDDIVIADDSVACQYRELLSILDMPISETKTHVSPHTYEFAKRWIQKGIEVTPFAWHGLLETWKRYYLFSNFIDNQRRHNWLLRDGDPEWLLEKMMRLRGKVRQIPSTLKFFTFFTLLHTVLSKEFTVWDKEKAALTLEKVLALPIPDGFTPIRWIKELAFSILKSQCKQEEDKLLKSKADLVNKIRDEFGKMSSDLQSLQTVLESALEYHPVHTAILRSQTKVTSNMIKLMMCTEEDLWEYILNKDFVGNNISLDIFNMRGSKTRIISASTIVKPILEQWRKYRLEEMGDFTDQVPK